MIVVNMALTYCFYLYKKIEIIIHTKTIYIMYDNDLFCQVNYCFNL